jgi:prepilin-type N-terminal cleavage/methylation domain-containing protein
VKPSIPNQRNPKSRAHSKAGGFSLLEMLISLALLGIVLAVAMEGIIQMQQRNFAETAKVDTVQETRDFVDQMVRDIHDVGYPPGAVKTGNPPCDADPTVACGLIYFTSTQVIYEGDLDGTGTVYRVWVQLEIPPSGRCPCKLQRGAVPKAGAPPGAAPTYFTEVNGVLNSGNGFGAATYPISLPGSGDYTAYGTADVFTAYDVNAALVPFCVTKTACSSIYSLQITANVAPNFTDPKTDIFPVYSVTSKARMNNNWLFN